MQFWLRTNRLSLNVGKSHVILIGSCQKLQNHELRITVGGKQLSQVTGLRYLGVYIDENLSWQQQTQNVYQRVQSRVHRLYRLCPLPDVLMGKLYCSFVLPILDYCDVVWSPSSIKYSRNEFIHSFVHYFQIRRVLYIIP